jgi:transcriptional pleiotropic regulator of transition state genes
MKSSGVVGQIDELGRIIVPAEIRTRLGIKEGNPLELVVDGEKLVFEKYYPLGRYLEQAMEFVRSFESATQRFVFVTNTEKVFASVISGFRGAPLSAELIEAISNRADAENIPLTAGANPVTAEYAAIIRDGSRDGHGKGIGAVVLVEMNGPLTDESLKTQMKIAADFLGRLANADGAVL